MFANKPWDPLTARRTYLLAAQLDPRFVPLRDALLSNARPVEEAEPGDGTDWLLLFTPGLKLGV